MGRNPSGAAVARPTESPKPAPDQLSRAIAPVPPSAHPVWLYAGAAVTALAFGLRVIGFPDIPPGLHFDEAFNGFSALEVTDGRRPIFFEGNNGREPFFIYLQALSAAAFGLGPFALRLVSLFLGTLTVALTIPLAREWLAALGWSGRDRRFGALAAGFFLATLLWHVHFSRFGFRAISLPFFEALGFYLFWRGLRLGRRRWLVLSGIAFGGAGYTYLSARVLPLLLLGLTVAVFLGRPDRRRRLWGGLAGFWAAAGLTIAPLAIYFLRHPDQALSHSADLAVWGHGPAEVIENGLRLAGMFFWAGDPNWRHNLAGRPAFDPLTTLLFLLGLGTLIAMLLRGHAIGVRIGQAASSVLRHAAILEKLRARSTSAVLGMSARRPAGPARPQVGAATPVSRAAAAVLLLWPPILLIPSLLSEGAPHFLRGIGVLPGLALFPAIGAGVLWQAGRRFPIRRPALAALAATLIAGGTAWAYFGQWASSADAYYIFHGHIWDVARQVRDMSDGREIYLETGLGRSATASLTLRDHRPATLDLDRLAVVPAEPALLVLPAGAGNEWGNRLWSGQPRRPLADRYGTTLYEAIDWPGRGVGPAPTIQTPRLEAAGAPAGPVTFGRDLRLAGTLAGEESRAGEESIPRPGAPYTTTLAWETEAPLPIDYHASLRLADSTGQVWAQSDLRLGDTDFPTSRWRTGDLIMTRLAVALPVDLPPGRYSLSLRLYDLESRQIASARTATGQVGEGVTLGDLTVDRPAPDAAGAFQPDLRTDVSLAPGPRLLGLTTDPPGTWSAGDLHVRLFWQVIEPPGRPLDLEVTWLGADRQPLSAVRAAPFAEVFPATDWQTGDAFQTLIVLPAPRAEAIGPTTLRVAWMDPATGQALASTELPGPTAAGRPRSLTPPSRLDAPSAARFGAVAELLGLNVEDAEPVASNASGLPSFRLPDGQLEVELIWRAGDPTGGGYRVFVHLVGDDLRPVTQHDGEPAGGRAPTTSWTPGEIIADRHTLPTGPDLAPGDWTLIAGLYDPHTGQRVQLADGADYARLAIFRQAPP